jgi:hypothetical protein
MMAGRFKQLAKGERLLACWFMVTGVIHFVIEGESTCRGRRSALAAG